MADEPFKIRTLDRHCYDGVCHCDWRLSIQNCEESLPMWYINIVNIVISGLAILLGKVCSLSFFFFSLKLHILTTKRKSYHRQVYLC